ncbi:MAG: hypothetical protein JWM31_3325 [Solirubrobacterales bacterium]|nr:hypothetical protein [Solirubrobacterales bacterium]
MAFLNRSPTVLPTVLAGLALATVPADAHAPTAKRFPAPGAERKVVRTVQIAFKEKLLAGRMGVKHEGVKVTPFTSGLVQGGKVLRASFTEGLPRGTITVSWRIKTADGDSEKGLWRFQVTTGSASHDHG